MVETVSPLAEPSKPVEGDIHQPDLTSSMPG
jgi:hypothetical protein